MNKQIFIISIIGLLMICCFSTSPVIGEGRLIVLNNSNILYVGGSGPGNYTTIQVAINAASNGDTIFVYNGTYYENVAVSKSINLIGENKEITTIISNDRIVTIEVDNVKISGFTITGCKQFWFPGIGIYSNFNFIINNRIINNLGKGIDILGKGNIIDNNTISNNSLEGIQILNFDNKIINNIIIKNSNGISISDGDNSYIGWNTIENNIKNGINLENCNNISIKSNTIKNNGIEELQHNIYLYNCANNHISTNILTNANHTYCMVLEHSNNNNIIGNIFSDSGHGILLTELSNENIIKDNIISKNKAFGIQIESANNKISKNNIYGNKQGIYLGSDNNSIEKNFIVNNKENGIDLSWGNCNLIYENTISNNSQGIKLWSSHSNQIYHNNFIINSINAFVYIANPDDECDNTWDVNEEGNYWSDYNGLDLDGNLIGDSPYDVLGAGENQDNYPLMVTYPFDDNPIDKEPPMIKILKPASGLYIKNKLIRFFRFSRMPFIIGSIIIRAHASDNDTGIQRVEIYIDEELRGIITSTSYKFTWTREKINLFKHKHDIKVIAFDYAGNNASDEITVRKFL